MCATGWYSIATSPRPWCWAIWGLGRSSVASADLSRPVGNRRCSPYVRGSTSIEPEDVSMNIRRKTISAILAITLIGIAPAWSQSLLKTLDPDKDGTVDLAEAKTAARKLFDK